MAVRVADTPEVSPLPATEPGPGYTTPRIFTVDYTGEPLKAVQTLSEAGRLREEARRADVKLKLNEAADMYYMKARELLVGEGGLLQRTGKQVTEKLNGKTFQEQAYDTLTGIENDLGSDFQLNDEERLAYHHKILGYNKQFYPAIVEHEATQKRAYAVNVQQNNIAVQAAIVSEGGNVDRAFRNVYNGYAELARIQGTQHNPKLFTSRAKVAVTQGASQYIANCILQGEPEKAQLWLNSNAQNVEKYVTADGLVNMQTTIKAALQAKQDNIASNAAAMRIAQNRTTPGALTTTLENDPAYKLILDNFMADAAEKKGAQGWETNEQSRRSYRQEGVSDFIVRMGGVEAASAVLAVAKVSGGTVEKAQAAVQSAIEQAAKAGNAQDFTKFLPPEAAAAYGDVMKRYQARLNHVATLDDYIADDTLHSPFSAPEDRLRRATIAKQKGDAIQAMRDGQDLATLNLLAEQYLQGNFDTTRFPQAAQLSPQAKLANDRLRAKIAMGTYATNVDTDLVYSLINNPEILKNLTELQLAQMRSRLGEQGWDTVQRRRRELAAGGVPGEVNLGTIENVLRDVAADHLGMSNADANSSDGKITLFYLSRELRPYLQRLKTQSGGKFDWSYDEYKARIVEYLKAHVSVKGTIGTRDSIAGRLKPGDLPDSLREPLARANGLDPDVYKHEPEAFLRDYRQAINNPLFSFGIYLTDVQKAKLIDQWQEATGTSEVPDDTLLARLYLCTETNDIPALRHLYSRGAVPITPRNAPTPLPAFDYQNFHGAD